MALRKKLLYNNIISHLEKDYDKSSNGADRLYKLWDITAHQGLLILMNRSYKGSKFNMQVKKETGETTYESYFDSQDRSHYLFYL